MTQSSPNSKSSETSNANPESQNPAPPNNDILANIDGIRQALTNPDLTIRLAALDQAWSYGAAGRACLQEALEDRSKAVRRRARRLLRQPEGTMLAAEPVWTLTERLDRLNNNDHVTRFANREVREFNPDQPLETPQQFAYVLRCDYDDEEMVADYLAKLVDLPGANQIEALVIGLWQGNDDICTGDSSSEGLVATLSSLSDRLPGLKALFIGDITCEECEISWLVQSDMSPILQAYPQLEILQVRGGTGLKFENAANHDRLKALILETGGLNRNTVDQVYAWRFPALEHLEFWFGSDNYGGDCWEQDLSPVLEDLCIPNLVYLGLRNSQFADEMVDRLARSPLLGGLQVLDLSMGTLSDAGAAKLLDCPAIRDLETLNVSQSYLSVAMIDQLRSLGIDIIAAEQRQEEDEEDPQYRRYCVVSE